MAVAVGPVLHLRNHVFLRFRLRHGLLAGDGAVGSLDRRLDAHYASPALTLGSSSAVSRSPPRYPKPARIAAKPKPIRYAFLGAEAVFTPRGPEGRKRGETGPGIGISPSPSAGERRGAGAHIVAAPQALEPFAEIVEVEEDDRGRVEGQRLRDDEPADDGDPQRVAQLRAFAGAERQRQRAEQGGEGGHHDRAEAQEASLLDRLAGVAPLALRGKREIDHQNRVLLHDADEQ